MKKNKMRTSTIIAAIAISGLLSLKVIADCGNATATYAQSVNDKAPTVSPCDATYAPDWAAGTPGSCAAPTNPSVHCVAAPTTKAGVNWTTYTIHWTDDPNHNPTHYSSCTVDNTGTTSTTVTDCTLPTCPTTPTKPGE
jgi:hypothetical protein